MKQLFFYTTPLVFAGLLVASLLAHGKPCCCTIGSPTICTYTLRLTSWSTILSCRATTFCSCCKMRPSIMQQVKMPQARRGPMLPPKLLLMPKVLQACDGKWNRHFRQPFQHWKPVLAGARAQKNMPILTAQNQQSPVLGVKPRLAKAIHTGHVALPFLWLCIFHTVWALTDFKHFLLS